MILLETNYQMDNYSLYEHYKMTSGFPAQGRLNERLRPMVLEFHAALFCVPDRLKDQILHYQQRMQQP